MKKRELNKKRHLKTFLYVLFIFLTGVFIGNIITDGVSTLFSNGQEDINNYLLSLDLQMKLSEENICNVDVFELTKEKIELGRQLTLLENELGKNNPKLIKSKIEYTLLSIRQWMLVEEVKENCDNEISTILFFYSNEENTSANEDQGYILDYIYDRYPGLVVIYAFDYDIDTPALNTLKSIKGIDKTPTIIINGEKMDGFQSTYIIENAIFTN